MRTWCWCPRRRRRAPARGPTVPFPYPSPLYTPAVVGPATTGYRTRPGPRCQASRGRGRRSGLPGRRDPVDAVGIEGGAVHAGGRDLQRGRVVREDEGRVPDHDSLRLLVPEPALRLVGAGAGVVQELVDVGVRVPGEVAGARGVEAVDVAVGVDASRPAQHERLEVVPGGVGDDLAEGLAHDGRRDASLGQVL